MKAPTSSDDTLFLLNSAYLLQRNLIITNSRDREPPDNLPFTLREIGVHFANSNVVNET